LQAPPPAIVDSSHCFVLDFPSQRYGKDSTIVPKIAIFAANF
jgi:hypothetical protein